MVQNGSKWFKMVQIGSNWIKLVHIGLNRIKTYKIRSRWFYWIQEDQLGSIGMKLDQIRINSVQLGFKLDQFGSNYVDQDGCN